MDGMATTRTTMALWFETDGYDTYWSADDGYADLDPEEVK